MSAPQGFGFARRQQDEAQPASISPVPYLGLYLTTPPPPEHQSGDEMGRLEEKDEEGLPPARLLLEQSDSLLMLELAGEDSQLRLPPCASLIASSSLRDPIFTDPTPVLWRSNSLAAPQGGFPSSSFSSSSSSPPQRTLADDFKSQLRKANSPKQKVKIKWNVTSWSNRLAKKRALHDSAMPNPAGRTRSYVCSNVRCGTSSSPLWRKGWTNQDGTVSMLCNACGLHFKKGHFCKFCKQIFKESELENPLDPMKCCSICQQWFHVRCAHRLQSQCENETASFICPECV